MTRLRLLAICSLLLVPFLFLIVMGSYHLWSTGWIFYAWWPMAGCFATAYLLGWQWQKQHHRESVKAEIPPHSTNLDREAWKIVEQSSAKMPAPAQLDDGDFYFHQARSMSEAIAKVYYPNSRQSIGNVTLPELLTAIELAAAELRQKLDDYLPGSHLLTINNLQHTGTARTWVPRVQYAMWAGSAIMDPLRTGARFLANRYGVGKPLDKFQENLIGWFYATFVQRVGYYLIELYSGRLKVGTEEYRRVMMRPGDAKAAKPGDPNLPPLTVVVLGSATSAKTDLVRRMTGNANLEAPEKEAKTHRLDLHEVREELRLVDTPGYGELSEKERKAYRSYFDQADIVLWVSDASGVTEADRVLHADFRDHLNANPNRKSPPAIWVLTGLDSLPPNDDWSPPYDWHEPQRPKEHAIANAVGKLHEALGDASISVVPVNVAEDFTWGLDESLDPLLHLYLDDARSVAKLRMLEQTARAGRYGKVVDQVFSGSRQVVGGLLGRLRGQK